MHDAAIQIETFFLEGAKGALFCLYLKPADRIPCEGILYLHPFAEEMHKSRRMAALQARAFAKAGYAVLQVDLTGCGDSAGDFGDATWEIWRDDAQRAHAWLAARVSGPLTLWGLRIGASLAVDVAPELGRISRLLLWQPVINGEQFLTQFLRIKLASEMLSQGQTQSGSKSLKAALEAGEAIEVGGNQLSPQMARALTALKLSEARPRAAIEWMEVGSETSTDIMPASRHVAAVWREAGLVVQTQTLTGDPFWITPEITECPALLESTTRLLAL